MSSQTRIAAATLVIALATDCFAADALVGIGRVASQGEVAAKDMTVFPNGSGLPAGRGSVQQGRQLFNDRCATCHGVKGEGNDHYPSLAGGVGTLQEREPVLTVGSYWPYATTLWDYTRRAMPYNAPGSLSPDEVYAISAYVLHLNGIVGADAALDEKNLAAIQMPNRKGFVPDARRGARRSVSANASDLTRKQTR